MLVAGEIYFSDGYREQSERKRRSLGELPSGTIGVRYAQLSGNHKSHSGQDTTQTF